MESIFENYIDLIHWSVIFWKFDSFENAGNFIHTLIFQSFEWMHFRLCTHVSMMSRVILYTFWTQWFNTSHWRAKVCKRQAFVLFTYVFRKSYWIFWCPKVRKFAIFHIKIWIYYGPFCTKSNRNLNRKEFDLNFDATNYMNK